MRNELNRDLNDLLKEFLERELKETYYHYYEGKVENNNDPDQLGRCKIRVYGIYSDAIPTNDLPWAIPDFNFVGSKIGSFVVPPIDAIVNVYFDRGDIYTPHYTTKVIDKNQLPSERLTDYPNNMILFKTDEGDILEMNRQTKKLIFIHNSGTKLQIDVNGNVEVLVVGNSDTDINGNSRETSIGTMKKQATGVGSITVEQTTGAAKVEIDSIGNINITQGPIGSINIGGQKAQLFCPDLQVCPITGSPLSILTKIPGLMAKIT
jgi:hypothetical protein